MMLPHPHEGFSSTWQHIPEMGNIDSPRLLLPRTRARETHLPRERPVLRPERRVSSVLFQSPGPNAHPDYRRLHHRLNQSVVENRHLIRFPNIFLNFL
jgi:hypothetical protein